MLGVPLDGPTWLFGDNRSVVTSSTLPHSILSKCWNALSYHCCQEAVAAGIVCFEHVTADCNTSDFLTKNLPHYAAKDHINPLSFWMGASVGE